MADMDHAAPVTGQEFAEAIQALSPGLPIGVAVSGGSDSMALLHLTARWLEQAGQHGRLLVLTVDHGLRATSAAEAGQIGSWCREMGVSHKILCWQGVKPVSDIQAMARRARYELMTNACKEHGIACLLLGHQLEDQAETFLLRLGRGSGVDGLSAMAPEREWNGVRILRPLLGFSRSRLRATLKARQVPWIEDPSNHDPRFTRVRVREQLRDMAVVGLSPVRLAETAGRMRRVRDALEDATEGLMREAVQWESFGYACLNLPPLMAAPEEIGLRALSQVLLGVGGGDYPQRLAALERLYEWLKQNPSTGGRTLAGCRIMLRRHRLMVVREAAALGPGMELKPGETKFWDKRFQVRIEGDGDRNALKECEVREVGCTGLLQLKERLPKKLPPRIICQTLPGFWQGTQLLAAPHLGYRDPSLQLAKMDFEARFSPRNRELPDGIVSLVNV